MIAIILLSVAAGGLIALLVVLNQQRLAFKQGTRCASCPLLHAACKGTAHQTTFSFEETKSRTATDKVVIH